MQCSSVLVFCLTSSIAIRIPQICSEQQAPAEQASGNHAQPARLETITYQAALRGKRIEQRRAVVKLAAINDLKKQVKMVEPVMKTILQMLRKSREKFRSWNVAFLSLSTEGRDEFSSVLENTLFLSDLILRLPDSLRKLLTKEADFRDLFMSAVQFAKSTGVLEDSDLTALDLALQELNFLPRADDYVNVHTTAYKQQKEEAAHLAKALALKENTKFDKKKFKRTLMSGPSAGEL